MSQDYFIISAVILLAIVLVVVLIRKNKKDLKDFEEKLNRDYRRPEPSEHTEDPDDAKAS